MNPKFSKHILSPSSAAEGEGKPAPKKRGKAASNEAFASMKKTTAPVNFRLPADKLAKFKARCAANGDTMTSIFERAMDDYLTVK